MNFETETDKPAPKFIVINGKILISYIKWYTQEPVMIMNWFEKSKKIYKQKKIN